MAKEKVLAIVGPTCTGKTALSIKLAQILGAEIICADSRTVYRLFDIGTAKPSAKEMQGIRHHLLDVADPEDEFTAARFSELANAAIKDITARKKFPIVCGGTGFYSRALLEGLSIPAVPPQTELREQLNREADESGNSSIFQKLEKLDPVTAGRLNVNDRFRVIRALEVCLTTGQAFSDLAGKKEAPYEVMWIGLSLKDREKLRKLIELRIAEQMRQGMLDEVKRLYEIYGPSQKIMNTVNYRDLLRYLEGEISLEMAISDAERHNYQLARRQMMWFKTNPKINWFYTDEMPQDAIEAEITDLAKEFFDLT